MKHILYFKESLYKDKPKIGDYVLLDIQASNSRDLEKFVNSNVGQIVGVKPGYDEDVAVKYYNIPKNIKTWFWGGDSRMFHINNIAEFGTKEEMELKLQVKKYNL